MSLHIHRNSFNAGEISPLMGARVDVEKTRSGCRILENFIPRIQGGAFRRPGTLHVDEARRGAKWTEQTMDHAANLFFDGEDADPPTGQGQAFYVPGSVWLKNVRTIYHCTDATEGAAVWSTPGVKCELYGFEPGPDDDTGDGWDAGSLIYDYVQGLVYRCDDASSGAAVWYPVGFKSNLLSESAPTSADDATKGYEVGSIWVRNVRTLHVCTDSGPDWSTWSAVTAPSRGHSTRAPRAMDDDAAGFEVGSYWVWSGEMRVWRLESLDKSFPARLTTFNASVGERYILEFGDGSLRIWNPDGTLFIDRENPPYSDPFVAGTPYASEHLGDIQMAQLGNVAYFAHPDFPPQRLIRFFDASIGAEVFRWSAVEWAYPALRDWNTGEITAAPMATGDTFAKVRFSGNPFMETMDFSRYDGAELAIVHRREGRETKLDLGSGTGQSTTLFRAIGEYEFMTYGTHTGTIYIEKITPSSVNWVVVQQFDVSSDRQIVYRSAILDNVANVRIRKNISSGSGTAYLSFATQDRTGIGKIQSISEWTDGRPDVWVDVGTPFENTTPSEQWALGAWAEYAGYPRSVCFHEQRLWFGGTRVQPNTIWGSATNDFENFRRGVNDSDSVAFTLAASEGSAIQSLLSHQALVVFTQSEEWTVSTSEQTAITPSNIFVRRQSRIGSEHLQAILSGSWIAVVQRGGRRLREFRYSQPSPDMTLLAEHVTKGGIRQIAFQPNPDPVIWCVLGSGGVAALSIDPDQGVVGWSRHSTRGIVESVTVTYGDETGGDEVWISTLREIDGEEVRHISRFDFDHFHKIDEGDFGRLVYSDEAKIVEMNPPSDEVSGLGHLEGEEVVYLADGSPGRATVSGGKIGLASPASVVVAGLPFTSILQPSKIELELNGGTAQSRKWLCKRADLNLWRTAGLEYADGPGSPPDQWFPVPVGDDSNLDAVADPFTGMAKIVNLGSHRGSVDLTLRASGPLPANILAIIPKIEVSGV